MDFVEAGSYHKGRLRKLRLIAVHTTQGPGEKGGWAVPTARGVASWFSGGPGVSSHYVTDELETIQCVADTDTAWTAPGANADGLHLEQCGYAEWSRDHWLNDRDAYATLTRTAALVAAKCAEHLVPLRILTPADVAAGTAGVCDHYAITLSGVGNGDHWDCGGGYPIDVLAALAAGETPSTPTNPAPAPQEDDVARQYQDPNGTVWLVNPPFKTPLNSEGLRGDYQTRGLLAPPDEYFQVNHWTLDEFITVDPAQWAKLEQTADLVNQLAGSVTALSGEVRALASAVAAQPPQPALDPAAVVDELLRRVRAAGDAS
jgi:hypothetical protein